MHAIPKQTLKRMVQGYVNGMLANESPEVKTLSKRARGGGRADVSSTNKVVLEKKNDRDAQCMLHRIRRYGDL